MTSDTRAATRKTMDAAYMLSPLLRPLRRRSRSPYRTGGSLFAPEQLAERGLVVVHRAAGGSPADGRRLRRVGRLGGRGRLGPGLLLLGLARGDGGRGRGSRPGRRGLGRLLSDPSGLGPQRIGVRLHQLGQLLEE